ncbi:MAG: glycosyltransferase family 4 protein [Bacteroidales bacterium]
MKKIVIINSSESVGGAAIASRRLFGALRNEGVDASMIVRDKSGVNHNVHSLTNSSWDRFRNKFTFLYERAVIFLNNGFRKDKLFSVSLANSGISIHNHPAILQADIIHLHWINQGMLSLREIGELIALGKPIVWTLHDMWPITAICHHARSCKLNQTHCDKCPQLLGIGRDISYYIFNKKQKLYSGSNIHFVACSEWLEGLAKKSALTKGCQVCSIPNPIDTNKFYPSDSNEDRARLGLPLDKRLILFGALNLTDPRKGISYLIEALKIIAKKRNDIELVVFGQVKQELRSLLPFNIHSMGYLSSESDIVALYNAVDLFVTPSLEENLPNTIMEAISCGTPCVGFRIGGIPEMISHMRSGYVADYCSSEDLARGIVITLDTDNYTNFSDESRNKAVTEYGESTVAKRYMELYESIL